MITHQTKGASNNLCKNFSSPNGNSNFTEGNIFERLFLFIVRCKATYIFREDVFGQTTILKPEEA